MIVSEIYKFFKSVMVGPGRFMTEMGLGGENKVFSSMNHIPKMLRFQVMQLFCFPVPLHKGNLASSLRFARNKI